MTKYSKKFEISDVKVYEEPHGGISVDLYDENNDLRLGLLINKENSYDYGYTYIVGKKSGGLIVVDTPMMEIGTKE